MQNKSKMHWWIVAVMCGIVMTGGGFVYMATGVFIAPITQDFGVYHGSVAMHNTVTLLFAAFMTLQVSPLMNRFSLKKVFLAGALLVGGANYFIGWSNTLWQLNVLGALRGIGSGLLIWVPVTIVINEWFEEKHSLATSIVLSFSSITGSIFAPLFTLMIENIGWSQTHRFMGILAIVCSLPAVLLNYTLDPRDSGYLPYGMTEGQVNVSGQAENGDIIPEQRDISGAYSSFILLLIFGLCQTMLTGLPQHFTSFAESIGVSVSVGGSLISAAMLSSIIFKLLVGYLSDTWGAVPGTMMMLILTTLGTIVLMVTNNVPILLFGAIMFGAVYTLPTIGVTILMRHFYGRYLFQRLFPMMAFVTNIGSAVAISAIGYLYDFTGSYNSAFLIALVVGIMDIIIILYVQKKYKSQQVAVN